MILPDDPDFHEGGNCALKEQMPAPQEVVDGVVFEYHNNPVLFIQGHIPLFVEEKRHREKHGSMPDFSRLDVRWLEAEAYFDSWAGQYRRRMEELERARLQREYRDTANQR